LRFATVVRPRPPMQLVSQGLVIAVAGYFYEAEGDRGFANRNAMLRRDRNHILAIHYHGRTGGCPAHRHSINLVRGIDDGPIRKCVAANRSDDERRQFLTKNWTSGRKAMGRRADRRADDQAVASEVQHGFAVHNQVQFDHVKWLANMDTDVIEAEKSLTRFGRCHDTFEHKMARDAIIACNDAREGSTYLLRAEIGKKTELPKVYAKNRCLRITHLPSCAKNRPVAAENQGQICADLA